MHRSIPTLSSRDLVSATLTALAVTLGCAGAADSIELTEAKTALGAALGKVVSCEKRLAESGQKIQTLGEGLAAANTEARLYREDYEKLRLQMEALGVGLLRQESRGLDKRLLDAVSDLRLATQRNEVLSEHAIRLSESVIAYMGSALSPDADSKARVESELRAVDDILGLDKTAPLEKETQSLDGTRIVSIKPEYGLLVLNAGENDGVRVGAPLQIMRWEEHVASAIVVDVRDSICGAVVTHRPPNGAPAKVGDTARLDTNNNFKN